MRNITTYLKESIDIDNLAWKLEIYFKNKPMQKKEFMKLVEKQNNNYVVTDEDIDNFIKSTNVDLKKLIDFLSEEIDNDPKDYRYLLKKAIENCIDKKPNETL